MGIFYNVSAVNNSTVYFSFPFQLFNFQSLFLYYPSLSKLPVTDFFIDCILYWNQRFHKILRTGMTSIAQKRVCILNQLKDHGACTTRRMNIPGNLTCQSLKKFTQNNNC